MTRTFSYIAVDSNGRKRRGVIEANDREQAIKALRVQGLHATNMTDSGEISEDASAFGPQAMLDQLGFTFVNLKAMAVYTRKLASMINAGLSYLEIFDILAEESENRRLRYISRVIKEDITKGKKITESLAKFPNVFTKVFRSMINAGESTGRLDSILNRLADMYDREYELRMNVISKMYFPIIYLIAGLGVVALAIFVVPVTFGSAYQIVSPSFFFQVISFYGFIAILALLARTQVGYRIFRSIMSVVPPFSGLMRKMSLARFSRLFAAMYGAGVPVISGLDIAGETLMEPDLQYGLKHVKTRINQGDSLTESIASSGVFPHSLRGMIKTGETSGNVEEMLNKLADYYEIEISTQSSMLASFFTVLVLVIVLGTLAIFVLQAWGNYFSFVESFIDE